MEELILLFGIFTSILILVLSYLYFCWLKKVKRFDHLPTPAGRVPIIGHLLRTPRDVTQILNFDITTFKETKSKIQMLWLSFFPLIYVYDTKIIEDILKSNIFLSKGATYDFLEDLLKSGLIRSNGEKWKSRRKLLTPAFHFGILKSNASVINRHSALMIKHLKENILKHPIQDMQGFFKPFSLAVICESAMGVHCDFFDKAKKENKEIQCLTAVDKMIELLLSRVYKPWLHNNFIYKHFSDEGKTFYEAVDTFNSFVTNVIESRLEGMTDNHTEESSIFVDILLNAYKRNEIDIEGILEEVNTFMVAGYETVSTTMVWTLYSIGHDQTVQNKLYNEMKNLNFESLAKDDVDQLKYLDCVIKEALRLHYPVPVVSRFIDEDAVFGDTKIPAGATVAMHFYLLHRDEANWENPSQFIPERFLNTESGKRNPFSYVPFSAGPRNCIGQRFALLELKLMLCHLIKNFHFKSTQEESELGKYAVAVLRAKNGILLEITDR